MCQCIPKCPELGDVLNAQMGILKSFNNIIIILKKIHCIPNAGLHALKTQVIHKIHADNSQGTWCKENSPATADREQH